MYHTKYMQSLNDDEQRQVLGEVLADQLQAILEYVQEIPDIKYRLQNVEEKVTRIDNRLIIVERIARDHEADLKMIKQQLALA